MTIFLDSKGGAPSNPPVNCAKMVNKSIYVILKFLIPSKKLTKYMSFWYLVLILGSVQLEINIC